MNLTDEQQEAIGERGNVLVVASAGTGKTSTLVERCLRCLVHEEPAASLDEILIVTFTEAAAAEIKKRVRARLEEELRRAPSVMRWHEQLALFETANIGTLHSFCLKLVRQHFYQLELDPRLSVLPEEEASLLANATLEEIMDRHYAGHTADAQAVQGLILDQGRGWDIPIKSLVLKLHHYTQTLPDPAGWFAAQLVAFDQPEPRVWEQWLLDSIGKWRNRWGAFLKAESNELASSCSAILDNLKTPPSREELASALSELFAIAENCPFGKKQKWLKPLEGFLKEARFLNSLALQPDKGHNEPLAEDWNWVRHQMATLLRLADEFGRAFTENKRELAALDFHDLEQYALRLLWDRKAGAPTPIARHWQRQLRFVLVDEYQDINAAQDKIIQALSREGQEANRFLVGDVKQSIYRFRLANPRIFQAYARTWRNPHGRVIPLRDNFRCREGLLNFVNSLFATVIRPEHGGVEYDQEAQLRFGAPEERPALSEAALETPCVELHIRVKGNNSPEPSVEFEGQPFDPLELDDAEKEARMLALRLQELKAQKFQVWDQDHFRALEWKDVAILLRSPANKGECYAKEFARLGVPLMVEGGGFYQSLEVTDLLSLLQLLDNPLQDLPVLAVLRSPLVGLKLDELASIRLESGRSYFWIALNRWEEREKVKPSAKDSSETFQKVHSFLERFARWRRLARQVSLSRCIETILSETHYAEWLLTQPRGEQRHANLQRLLTLAQQFDQFQRQGLFRFLRFIEAQQIAETEPEVAAVSAENSVRLMSIHQSKGLEFPVVVAAGLSKKFNVADIRAELILDEKFGLCPQVKPPHTGSRYPSLPYWLAAHRQRRELLGEEARLLYVAATRARDLLILTCSLTKAKLNRTWTTPGPATAVNYSPVSYSDWIGSWLARVGGGPIEPKPADGKNSFLRWIIHSDAELLRARARPRDPGPPEIHLRTENERVDYLEKRLSWAYEYLPATRNPAKTSVSAVRSRAAELSEESVNFGSGRVARAGLATPARGPDKSGRPAGAETGSAYHAFLESVSLDRVASAEELQNEAQRLLHARALSQAEIALLDFDKLAAFWNSDVGLQVRAHSPHVRREIPFTARLSPAELRALTGEAMEPRLNDEFVVVQGVADLVVVLPTEIWLVDFKTDASDDLTGKHYDKQLKLYAVALERIYRRPVSRRWIYFLTQQRAIAL